MGNRKKEITQRYCRIRKYLHRKRGENHENSTDIHRNNKSISWTCYEI